MFKTIEIAFVGYPVTDIARARQFYESVLCLTPSMVFEAEGGAWIEYDIGATTLAISNLNPQWKPSSSGGSAALEVEDFDAAVRWLKDRQVPFTVEPFPTPVCRMAVIADPDGNALAVHKRNPSS